MVDDIDDARRNEPSFISPEREMLEAWLEFHRATLAMKCADLTADQLRLRSVPPSALSLLGLVRHMGGVEYNWFRFWLGGETPNPPFDDDEDWAIDDADVASTFEFWRAECERLGGGPRGEARGVHAHRIRALPRSRRWRPRSLAKLVRAVS